jgi:hypothetical protein
MTVESATPPAYPYDQNVTAPGAFNVKEIANRNYDEP